MGGFGHGPLIQNCEGGRRWAKEKTRPRPRGASCPRNTESFIQGQPQFTARSSLWALN